MNGLFNNLKISLSLSHAHLTYRLILLQLKNTLLIITHWWIVIHILHQDLNLHGWIHLSVIVIRRPHNEGVLKQNQHRFKNNS